MFTKTKINTSSLSEIQSSVNNFEIYQKLLQEDDLGNIHSYFEEEISLFKNVELLEDLVLNARNILTKKFALEKIKNIYSESSSNKFIFKSINSILLSSTEDEICNSALSFMEIEKRLDYSLYLEKAKNDFVREYCFKKLVENGKLKLDKKNTQKYLQKIYPQTVNNMVLNHLKNEDLLDKNILGKLLFSYKTELNFSENTISELLELLRSKEYHDFLKTTIQLENISKITNISQKRDSLKLIFESYKHSFWS